MFLVAGLCEIGGSYLYWLWLREGESVWLAVIGVVIPTIYAILPTLQPANFGCAYGGVFIVLSILWG